MVELGLSVKWLKYNMGATGGSSVADWYGSYYAWGEQNNDITGKTDYEYSWYNYKYATDVDFDGDDWSYTITKYNDSDNKTNLTSGGDDIVNSVYGEGYRMPTRAELSELSTLSNETVDNYNGISGLKGKLFHGTGDYSSNTLFIPFSGYCERSGRTNLNSGFLLWSASIYESDYDIAWSYGTGLLGVNSQFDRFHGMSIRGISTI